MPLASLLALLLLAVAPPTAPQHFFVGRTEGARTVQMIMSGSHKVRDHSRGGGRFPASSSAMPAAAATASARETEG